jgi:hypothetical protein
MKKIVFLDPQVMMMMGTTYQVGDYDDYTSLAIVNTPGYETLTIDDKDASN